MAPALGASVPSRGRGANHCGRLGAPAGLSLLLLVASMAWAWPYALMGAGLCLHTGPLSTWLVAWSSEPYRQHPGSLAVSISLGLGHGASVDVTPALPVRPADG